MFIKLVNAASTPSSVSIVFEGLGAIKAINVTRLSHTDERAFNYLGNATIVPKLTAITNLGDVVTINDGSATLKHDIPGLSVEVIEVV